MDCLYVENYSKTVKSLRCQWVKKRERYSFLDIEINKRAMLERDVRTVYIT